jgi:hypothetical protein
MILMYARLGKHWCRVEHACGSQEPNPIAVQASKLQHGENKTRQNLKT